MMDLGWVGCVSVGAVRRSGLGDWSWGVWGYGDWKSCHGAGRLDPGRRAMAPAVTDWKICQGVMATGSRAKRSALGDWIRGVVPWRPRDRAQDCRNHFGPTPYAIGRH